MNDQEFIKLRNSTLISIAVVIAFMIPIILIFRNKFDLGTSKINQKIDKQETLMVFIVNPECNNCKDIEKTLSTNNVQYYKLDTSKKVEYDTFLQKLAITENEIIVPTLMYIEKGKLYSTLVDINDEDLNSFINNYGMNN